MNIYVSNLSYATSDQDLMQLFAPYGQVSSAKVIMDKFSNRSKGFGFVEVTDSSEGEKAIKELNGTMNDGRPLVVNEAKPKKDKW
jgi:RNA recognition motif-containing protein